MKEELISHQTGQGFWEVSLDDQGHRVFGPAFAHERGHNAHVFVINSVSIHQELT